MKKGATGNNNSTKKDLDTAFRLIEEGHDFKHKGDHWLASHKYAEAAQILEQLRRQQSHDTAEQIKIASLYHTKAIEFLKAARLSFVAALEYDTTTDHHHGEEDANGEPSAAPGDATKPTTTNDLPLLNTKSNKNNDRTTQISEISSLLQNLTDEDCQNRLALFARLFAKEDLLLLSCSNNNNKMNDKSVDEEASKLEERLLQLNNSIPRFLKTNAEKIRDLNQGLRRLGLATVEETTTPSATMKTSALFLDDMAPPKSEFDQINDIIHQAQDEVKYTMNKGERPAEQLGTVAVPNDEEIEVLNSTSSVNDDDEEEEEDDVNLTTDTCRSIHENLLSVEVSLAELMALFEVDAGGNAEIEFDQARGRHLLKDARTKLKMVEQQWKDSSA